MDGDAGDPVQRSGVEATGTEEAALAMAKTHRPDSTPEPELDWNERPLDRGEPDELRKSAAYQPRPPGGAADVAPPGRLEHDGVPDFESIDAALEENGLDVPLAVLHDAEAEDDPVADTPATGDAAPADPVEPRPHVEPRAPEPASEPAVPAATTAAETRDSGRAPVPADVSLFDQMEQDPDAPNDQSSFDAPGAVVPDDEDPADHAELDGSDPASDAPDSQAAGVYEAITLSELQDRLGETVNRPQDDPHDEAGWHAGSSSAVAPDHAASTDADDDDENAHDRSFAFEPASEDDYYHHGDDEDEARVGVLAGLTDRARGLPIVPLALITVVIVVAAFVAGFGWVAAGDGRRDGRPGGDWGRRRGWSCGLRPGNGANRANGAIGTNAADGADRSDGAGHAGAGIWPGVQRGHGRPDRGAGPGAGGAAATAADRGARGGRT